MKLSIKSSFAIVRQIMIFYRNYNSRHRGLRNGEIHLCIIINGNRLVTSNRSSRTMKYSSARKGSAAYDRKGRFLANSYPVFVSEYEYCDKQFLIWTKPILIFLFVVVLIFWFAVPLTALIPKIHA
jgi:hypothetical protein